MILHLKPLCSRVCGRWWLDSKLHRCRRWRASSDGQLRQRWRRSWPLFGVLARTRWSQREAPRSMLQQLGLGVVVQLAQLVAFTQIPDQEQLLAKQQSFQAAQQAAMPERSILRTLSDTLPDLIWLKDTHGIYLACNHRSEQFFGACVQDIVGKTLADFFGITIMLQWHRTAHWLTQRKLFLSPTDTANGYKRSRFCCATRMVN